jgi:hypothetical protein
MPNWYPKLSLAGEAFKAFFPPNPDPYETHKRQSPTSLSGKWGLFFAGDSLHDGGRDSPRPDVNFQNHTEITSEGQGF